MALKRKKKSDKRKLIEKLDTVFSQYIRLRDAQPGTGLVRCISCGAIVHWTKIQDGHYVSRASMATRFDERNNWPQCMPCNVFKHGNLLEYRRALIEKLGEQTVDYIEYLGHTTKKWSDWELAEMIKYYSALVAKLKEDKGL